VKRWLRTGTRVALQAGIILIVLLTLCLSAVLWGPDALQGRLIRASGRGQGCAVAQIEDALRDRRERAAECLPENG